jgi:hypothetical protein
MITTDVQAVLIVQVRKGISREPSERSCRHIELVDVGVETVFILVEYSGSLIVV